MKENRSIEDLKESFNLVEIPIELDLVIEKAIQDGKKAKNKFYFNKTMVAAACVAFLFISVTMAMKLTGNSYNDILIKNDSGTTLPKLGNKNNLKKLLEDNYKQWAIETKEEPRSMKGMGIAEAPELGRASKAASDATALQDYSGTNVQVAGVDEGDTVKTDGEYIYKIHQPSMAGNPVIKVIKAEPAESMSLVKDINVADMYPREIFISGQHLVVIGDAFEKPTNTETPRNPNEALIDRTYIRNTSTTIEIYDLKDKNNISRIRKIDVDGTFSTARIVEKNVYIISNKNIMRNWFEEGATDNLIPKYSDSAVGDNEISLDLSSISYFPEAIEPNYIIVSSFDLNRMQQEVKVTTTLGSANNMYSSSENLYVASTNYYNTEDYKTTIYKFNLNKGEVEFVSTGEVPGTILNQFSMDENNEYFRVTTTKDSFKEGANQSVNNLYILDKDMKLVGKIEDLAKGERIYSTRFMGDRAYMVTFETTDPLFVIDLKNPKEPKVLGELKIPGYSDYLHPYDENHIIGMGKDAEVVMNNGRETAYQQGVKLALFDVSDVNNPKVKFSTVIGDRGTESDALYNHKAIMFSKAKNLLAFPISVANISEEDKANSKNDMFLYGKVSFMGAYVFNIDLDKGFTLKGGISHIKDMNMESSNFNWDGRIERILYIGDNVYTLSNSEIKSNNINDLKEVGSLLLK